jgi:RNA polymerase sigma-70 factor (ECF subfamily)|tara:strand:+ start:5270 stop:5863 length:594 start_codon:yes stop_codon:yes gene_type:complete
MTDQWKTRRTLLLRAKDPKDKKAWNEFVKIYKNFIYHLLHKMNVDPSSIEDVSQNVLLQLWKKLSSYDPEKAKFRTWLSVVIRNIALNHFRSEKKRFTHSLEENAKSQIDENATDALDRMIQEEWKMHIMDLAMEKMETLFSPNAIQVFALSLKGLPQKEIGAQLGISPDSVKVLKHRVRGRFIEEMRSLIHELEET